MIHCYSVLAGPNQYLFLKKHLKHGWLEDELSFWNGPFSWDIRSFSGGIFVQKRSSGMQCLFLQNVSYTSSSYTWQYVGCSLRFLDRDLKLWEERWNILVFQTHRIHVWYIWIHLPQHSTKCRQICHTWILWEIPCEDRCLDPQTRPEKAFGSSKHLLTKYLEDFGRLGIVVCCWVIFFTSTCLSFFPTIMEV